MAFALIYARRDGTFTARFGGPMARGTFAGGTVACESQPGTFATEREARDWIALGAHREGVDELPDPRVIRTGAA